MAEFGESSASKSPQEIWAKLVPSDSRHSDIEIKSDEFVVCSVIRLSSFDKHEWCTLKRNSDLCSATLQRRVQVQFLLTRLLFKMERQLISSAEVKLFLVLIEKIQSNAQT